MGYCFWSISLYVCIFLYFFLCFFVSKITRKRLDRCAWNFQGRCGVSMGRHDSIFGQFRETARCRDANFFAAQHYEWTAGPICMKFSGKVWWPWDDVITLLVNSEKPWCATRGRGLLCFRTTACLIFALFRWLFYFFLIGSLFLLLFLFVICWTFILFAVNNRKLCYWGESKGSWCKEYFLFCVQYNFV